MRREDTIFVAGMPASAGMNEIAKFFGQIGVIKVDKLILILLLDITYTIIFFCTSEGVRFRCGPLRTTGKSFNFPALASLSKE